MDTHIKLVHEKMKPHLCSLCGYASGSKGDLKNHVVAVHDKAKPYKCSFCDFACSMKSNLNKHVTGVHDKKKAPDPPLLESSEIMKSEY